jgi:hypothetical protein
MMITVDLLDMAENIVENPALEVHAHRMSWSFGLLICPQSRPIVKPWFLSLERISGSCIGA